MSCPSCVNAACPETVPTITVTEATVEADAVIDTFDVAAVSATKKTVSIQVAEAGYWLLKCWFVDAATPTHVESVTPPESPGASFFKVTDATGLCEFDVENTDAMSWYLCAAVIGPVSISDPIAVGA